MIKDQVLECVDHLNDIKRILKETTQIELRIKIVTAKVDAAIESLKVKEDYHEVHPISTHTTDEPVRFIGE